MGRCSLPQDVWPCLGVPGLAEPLSGSLFTVQVLVSLCFSMLELGVGFCMSCAPTSPPVRELGTLEKKAKMDPHLEETIDSSQLKVRL